MQTSVLPVRQGRDRIQRSNTINASAEFIENACPLAVDSQYVPELDKFVPISEARSYADTMWACSIEHGEYADEAQLDSVERLER